MTNIPENAAEIIKKLCSTVLGRNSVRDILSTKTPDGVIRTTIEAIVREKSESIGRGYLSQPEVLKTMKGIQACDNVLEYIFSVFHNGVKENYFVCLCSKNPRLGTYKPVRNLIINLP